MAARTENATTLLQYLSQKNPKILETKASFLDEEAREYEKIKGNKPKHKTRGSSTKSPAYPTPERVKKWKDFNLKTLNAIFNGKLKELLDSRRNFADFSGPDPAFLSIYDENALESLLIKWNQSVVLEGLRSVSKSLNQREIAMVRGGQAELIAETGLKPDWAGITNGPKEFMKPLNILPGDTKTSWSWSSEDIPPENEKYLEDCWPLRQIAAYCLDAYSRYGYLITDKELIVFRVSSSGAKLADEDVAEIRLSVERDLWMEYQTIPWDSSKTTTGLTVNLALWALHILAANNGRLATGRPEPLKNETIRKDERGLRRRLCRFTSSGEYSEGENVGIQLDLPNDTVQCHQQAGNEDTSDEESNTATSIATDDNLAFDQSMQTEGSTASINRRLRSMMPDVKRKRKIVNSKAPIKRHKV